eukprot:80592-Pelagomonas_calceolata.AAC.1
MNTVAMLNANSVLPTADAVLNAIAMPIANAMLNAIATQAGGDTQVLQVVGIEVVAAAEPPTPPSHSKKQSKQPRQQQQQQQAAPLRGLPLCRITASTQLEVISQQQYWQQQQQQQQQQQVVHELALASVDEASPEDECNPTSASGVLKRKEKSSSCSNPSASRGPEGGVDSALRKGSKSGAGGLKKKAPEGEKKKKKKKVKEDKEAEEEEEEGAQAVGHLASKFDILQLMDEDA